MTNRPKLWLDWAHQIFGVIALDPRERTLRFIEEAIEVTHVMDIEPDVIKAIIDRVYSKNPGVVHREIGQAMGTLECLAESINIDAALESEREYERVHSVPQSEWEKRHQAKVDIGIASPIVRE